MRLFGMILIVTGVLALVGPVTLIVPLIQYACSMNTAGCRTPADELIGDFIFSADAVTILWLPAGAGLLAIALGRWLRAR